MTRAAVSELVVEVLHNRGTDCRPDWTIGSGYFVAPNLVLTALHNVDEAGELLVRVHGSNQAKAVEYPAKVLHPGTGSVDLALVEVPTALVNVQPLRYAVVDRDEHGVVVEGCRGVGFPRFKERKGVDKDKPQRLSYPIHGDILTDENLDQSFLTLHMAYSHSRALPPLRPDSASRSEWEGISGTVVFAETDLVVGVITEHVPPEGECALTVVPITAVELLGEEAAATWWSLLGVERSTFVHLPREKEPTERVRTPVRFLPEDLPPYYVKRRDTLKEVYKRLLQSPPPEHGGARRVALHALSGQGKSVLARALWEEDRIRAAFPDGVLWGRLTQHGNGADEPKHSAGTILTIQRDWMHALGRDDTAITGTERGKADLLDELKDRAVLLVLDDVWSVEEVEALRVGGPHCGMVLTTQRAEVADGAELVELGPLTAGESLRLLKRAAGSTLPAGDLADTIVSRLGHHPLAIDIVGRMVRHKVPWSDVSEALDEGDITFIDMGDVGPQRSVFAAINAMVRHLPRDTQARYRELAIFARGERLPVAAVKRLWERTGGLKGRYSQKLLADLEARALISTGRTLHDLLVDYLRTIVPDDERVRLHGCACQGKSEHAAGGKVSRAGC
jgi:NB-ARC domain/Trypsin-like peptidase domain